MIYVNVGFYFHKENSTFTNVGFYFYKENWNENKTKFKNINNYWAPILSSALSWSNYQ